MVLMLPFIEQQSITAMIEAGGTACHSGGTYNYPAKTYAATYDVEYVPWTTIFSARLCPSDKRIDRQKGEPDATGDWFPGSSNYRACIGDYINGWNTDKNTYPLFRGVFRSYTQIVGCDPAKFNDGLNQGRDISEITDGMSNTIAISEARIAAGVGDALSTTAKFKNASATPATCLTAIDPNNRTKFKTQYATEDYNGRRWCCGSEWIYSACQTIMSPNSPTCLFHWGTDNYQQAIMCTVSSYHTGGVNAAMADGSASFITNTIDTGDTSKDAFTDSKKGPSNYGIWGALGTINGGETKTP
jgi:prepilin-type processing-associated H-X9-DG protein